MTALTMAAPIPGKAFMIAGALALAGLIAGALSGVRESQPAPALAASVSSLPKFDQRWEDPELAVLRKADRLALSPEPQPLPVRPEKITVSPQGVVEVKPVRRVVDVCSRHGLRKVLTNGGRSWRCRR